MSHGQKHNPMQGKHNGGEEGESPIGFIMFGDLMSQLLCFFVLLFVFASQNISKTEGSTFEQVLKELSKNFTDSMAGKTPLKAQPKIDEKQKIVNTVNQAIMEQKLVEFIEVVVEEKRIRLVLPQPLLFESGHSELKANYEEILAPIGDILRNMPNNIVVEGHTDNVPINPSCKYRSNWELSFFRAYNILSYLVNQQNIPPKRLTTMGYGEFYPRVPNDSEKNRTLNRRIEIDIMM